MSDEPSARGEFAAFPFDENVATAFPVPDPELLDNPHPFLDPLLDRVIGSALNPLGTQPDRADAKTELERLIHGRPERRGLAYGGGDKFRTQTIAKAACAALLGSAAMLVQ